MMQVTSKRPAFPPLPQRIGMYCSHIITYYLYYRYIIMIVGAGTEEVRATMVCGTRKRVPE